MYVCIGRRCAYTGYLNMYICIFLRIHIYIERSQYIYRERYSYICIFVMSIPNVAPGRLRPVRPPGMSKPLQVHHESKLIKNDFL